MLQSAEQKIISIILETWDANKAYEILSAGSKDVRSFTFNLWVSYIMTYGYKPSTVLNFAKKYGITHDPKDCDPDDPSDEFGALVLTAEKIEELKKSSEIS